MPGEARLTTPERMQVAYLIMQFKRILAIGDLRGEFKKMKALLKKVKSNPQEELPVYLGDYIDRGSEPVACFQLKFL